MCFVIFAGVAFKVPNPRPIKITKYKNNVKLWRLLCLTSTVGQAAQNAPTQACRCIGGSCHPVFNCVSSFAASEIRLLYSEKLLQQLVSIIPNKQLTIQRLSETLSAQLLSTAQCDIFAYQAIDGDVILLVAPVTRQPTHLQRRACAQEAARLTEFINQRHPLITSQALTSFLLAAEVRAPVLSAVHSAAGALRPPSLFSLSLLWFCIVLSAYM